VNYRHFGGVRRHVPNVVLVGEDEPRANVGDPLAVLAVGLSDVIVPIALAGVRPLSVGALLRAGTGDLYALVDVCAGLSVGHEFVAGSALALVALCGVDALVAALVVFDARALVDAAVEGLVGSVGAVLHFVADEVASDALLDDAGDGVATLELVVGAVGF
jgi:hypothetical protein